MNLRTLFAVLLLLLVPSLAAAGDYVLKGGYYWRDGAPYLRTTYYVRDARGCLTAHYRYAPAPIDHSAHHIVRSETRDWRDAIAQIVKTQVEYREFNAALAQLGVTRYGDGLGLGNLYGAIGGDPYAGDTAYGYSYRGAADVFGNVDRQVLLERLARATENAQDLAGDAHRSLGELIDREGDKHERIAEILARGQTTAEALRATAELLRSSAPQPQTRVEARADVRVPRDSLEGDIENRVPLLTHYCAACHAGDAPKAGLVLDGSQPLDARAAQRASLAVLWGKGLASTAARRLVKLPMPPKTSTPIDDEDLPGVLAELGRLTLAEKVP